MKYKLLFSGKNKINCFKMLFATVSALLTICVACHKNSLNIGIDKPVQIAYPDQTSQNVASSLCTTHPAIFSTHQ